MQIGRKPLLIGVALGSCLLGGVSTWSAPASAAGIEAIVVEPAGVAARSVPFARIDVTRVTLTTYRLSWTSDVQTPVVVHAAADPHDPRGWLRVGSTSASTTTIEIPSALTTADRVWFRLTQQGHPPVVTADRSLHIASAPNLRDLGGYRTTDGRWLAMGQIYRSGDLSRLTEADAAKLARLGITEVLDLRTTEERRVAPNRLPAGIGERQINVLGDPFRPLPVPPTAGEARMVADALYRNLVADATSTRAYGEMVDALATPHRNGTIVQCNAGKDRTGWAAALLLDLLEVDRRTIIEDYTASNTYLARQNEAFLSRVPPELRPVYTVGLVADAAYLQAAHDEVRVRDGSMQAYYRRLGVHHAERVKLTNRLR